MRQKKCQLIFRNKSQQLPCNYQLPAKLLFNVVAGVVFGAAKDFQEFLGANVEQNPNLNSTLSNFNGKLKIKAEQN